MRIKAFFLLFLLHGVNVVAQNTVAIKVKSNSQNTQISKHIYGQFSEHLGRSIYDGFWVDESLNVEKKGRIRMDIVNALLAINIPNLRWPGGCFADEYHWRDGIGLTATRPKMINTNWGGITEDNSFGTHEFLELCSLLKTEPYICGNVGSGTVEEMSKWVEYLNMDGESPMSKLRKENGRNKPWNVAFWGVGNESWGCGGNMTPEYYADLYNRYASFSRDYPNAKLKKIAGGANSDDYNWTDVLMRKCRRNMWGLSLHYYTIPTGKWGDKGSATNFSEEEYFSTMKNCLKMEELVTKHSAVMDKYDPSKKIGLVVDEWGVWTNVEPGTNPGFLYQQNSMRDALVAGTTLNIFNNHSDRVKMANLAQTVNVLQSVILTDKDKILLTPTYWIFDMYKTHQDATLLPIEFSSPDFTLNAKTIPAINISASKDKDGIVHLTIVNLDSKNKIPLSLNFDDLKWKKASGNILTSAKYTDYNSFDNPNKIKPTEFKEAKKKGEDLQLTIPALSVVSITLN